MNNDKHLNDFIENQDKKDLEHLKNKDNKSDLEKLAEQALKRRVNEDDKMNYLKKFHGFPNDIIKTEDYKKQRATDEKVIDAYRESKRPHYPRHY